MQVLYVVSEAFPFVQEGELGIVAGAFPVVLAEKGIDIRVIMPMYDTILPSLVQQMKKQIHFFAKFSEKVYLCNLYIIEQKGVIWYFLDNDHFFHRGKLYGCEDDERRFAFFSVAVCEAMKVMKWVPDIIHCNDWQTAMIPVCLQGSYSFLNQKRVKIVYTIHNLTFPTNLNGCNTLTERISLPDDMGNFLEANGSMNLIKAAVFFSDCITTVSPTYAKKLMASDSGMSLSGTLSDKEIYGICNGININPMNTPMVHRPYDSDSVEEKVFNKLWMQEMHCLEVYEDAPVFGCVSRLMSEKGFDLLLQVLPEFLESGCQFVLTGDGDYRIVEQLNVLKARYPRQVSITTYSEKNAIEIFSSVDIFLMPSLEGLCGISQMLAMQFGAVPVVYATDGLKDTVDPYDEMHPDGCGFVFENYTAEAFAESIRQAVWVYWDTERFETLQRRCKARDFSWNEPVKAYIRLYQDLL